MSAIGIILSVIILSILIIVHEFGHYIVAKKNGVLVKEFAIGFGPKIVSWGKGETVFCIKAIPFGGSCRMLGALEDDTDEEEVDEERSFEKKSVWARMSIVLAGPFFNFLLAFFCSVIYIGTMGYDPAAVTYVEEGSPAYEAGIREGDVITKYNGEVIDFGREIYLENFIHPVTGSDPIEVSWTRDGESYSAAIAPELYTYYSMGISYYSNDDPAEIAEIVEGSAVEEAGLRKGDVVISVNGTSIESGEELGNYFDEHEVTGDTVTMDILRNGVKKTVDITPVEAEGYKIGIQYNMQNVKTDAVNVLKYSFCEMKYQINSVFKSLAYLFSGQGSLDMVSGPVGIVQIVGETYDASVSYGFVTTLMNILSIMTLLSANLGVINLLPLPVLDGGKFILLVIEAIRRKPLNKKYEGIVAVIFAVLLMAFALVVLVNDITKFF